MKIDCFKVFSTKWWFTKYWNLCYLTFSILSSLSINHRISILINKSKIKQSRQFGLVWFTFKIDFFEGAHLEVQFCYSLVLFSCLSFHRFNSLVDADIFFSICSSYLRAFDEASNFPPDPTLFNNVNIYLV